MHVMAKNGIIARRKGIQEFRKQIKEGDPDIGHFDIYCEYIFAGHVVPLVNYTSWGMDDKELKKL